MELTDILSVEQLTQGGFSVIMVYICIRAVIKLYNDKRADSKEERAVREKEFEARLKESREREERLMTHLNKQAEINERVAVTLSNIETRMCNIEKKI